MDKIIIKDLIARGIIGINDWERENIQDILNNLTIFADQLKEHQNVVTVARRQIDDKVPLCDHLCE